MIKIKSDVKKFQDAIRAIKAVNDDEAKFTVKEDGIYSTVISIDHVAAVTLKIPKEEFTSYIVDQEVTFGFKVKELHQKLQRFEKEMEITIEDRIKMKSGSKYFHLNTIQVKDDRQFPDMSFECKMKMPRQSLLTSLEDCEVVTNRFKISAEEEVTFSGQGQNPNDVYGDSPVVEREGKATSYYTLLYLKPMIKATEAVEQVTLEFSSELPMKISLGNIQYILGAWVNEKR
jgi:hypothetical protein